MNVDGRQVAKPSRVVTSDATIAVAEDPCPWVSRAALKLLQALERFALSPAGQTVLDIGASTGGFTEVCLSRGAAHVIAVDVGHGQMAPKLATDPRVTVLEGLNAKELTVEHLPAAAREPSWLVCDVSFISLSKVLPSPLALLTKPATVVVLVKPQFELGRGAIGKGGVVRDAEAQQRAVRNAAAFFEDSGAEVLGVTESPILGGDGNREYLMAVQW